MKDRKYIKIKNKSIVGILHPQVILEGKLKEANSKLEIHINGKKYASKFMKLNKRGDFVLISTLNKKIRKVDIVYKNNDEEFVIYSLRNNMIIRIGYKIKRILKKITVPFKELAKGIKFLWKEHHFLVPPVLWKKYMKRLITKIKLALRMEYYHPFKQKDYLKWIINHETKPTYKKLKYSPLISILIPVYNIERKYLSECLDSILNQKYQNFEVCLADDCSTLTETIETLKEYEKKDKRIKVVYRKENGHISKATNSALEIATGEFIGLMDNDDVITEDALYEMVLALNKNKNLDFIYSDEDKMDMEGNRCEPHFKPDYSPDSLLGGNYICHFEILRKSIMEEIGGFRSEYVGAQDFDLFLRFVEKTTPDRIHHIPKILYHWRKVPGSTADTVESKDYAIENGKKAVIDAMKRRNLDAEVITPIKSTHYIVEYQYKKEPLVSIIIPTRDMAKMLKQCIDSIYQKTVYKNFEIIIVDNNSSEEKTIQLFETLKQEHSNLKVISAQCEFNYSKINNLAVEQCRGEYLLFLNNDTKIISRAWLKSMVGYAMQKHIGAVGVKLLYPDDTIQHGGVILGIDGTARHAFLHTPADSFGFYGRLLVPYNYSAVTAACMLVSRKKFTEVNGFNEELKVAFNDIDLNLKLLKKGYYNIFLPQVEVYHYESKSRGLDSTTEKYKKFLSEKEYLQTHWSEQLAHDRFYNPNFSLSYDFMLDKNKEQ